MCTIRTHREIVNNENNGRTGEAFPKRRFDRNSVRAICARRRRRLRSETGGGRRGADGHAEVNDALGRRKTALDARRQEWRRGTVTAAEGGAGAAAGRARKGGDAHPSLLCRPSRRLTPASGFWCGGGCGRGARPRKRDGAKTAKRAPKAEKRPR